MLIYFAFAIIVRSSLVNERCFKVLLIIHNEYGINELQYTSVSRIFDPLVYSSNNMPHVKDIFVRKLCHNMSYKYTPHNIFYACKDVGNCWVLVACYILSRNIYFIAKFRRILDTVTNALLFPYMVFELFLIEKSTPLSISSSSLFWYITSWLTHLTEPTWDWSFLTLIL